MTFAHPPIVVFGTGGSGTRAIAEVLRAAGVHMGTKRNAAGDSQVLKPFVRRWPERYLEQSGWVQAALADAPARDLPDPDPAMTADLLSTLAEQRDGIAATDAPWGWKNPRTIYLFPAVHRILGDLLSVQLVRDGRDMAFSPNQQQVEAYGDILVGDLAGAALPVRSIALWSRVNIAAARYGAAAMAGHHLVMRYEDLCDDPRSAMTALLEHLEIEPSPALLDRAAELVAPSPSRGRWRDADPVLAAELADAGAAGLREFGYAGRD